MTARTTTAQLSQRIDALKEALTAAKAAAEKQTDDFGTIIASHSQSIDEVVRDFKSWVELINKIDEPAKEATGYDADIANNSEAMINLAGKTTSYHRLNADEKSAFNAFQKVIQQAEKIASPQPHTFSTSIFGRLVGMLPTVVPWALVVAGLLYWYRFQSTEIIDPPTPTPDVPAINKAVGDYFPTQRKEFAAAFADAAAKVRSKEIKTDEQLDALVNPQLKTARDLASKPFDVSFEMGLPRNDDGSFAGKEEDAAKFLELISRSW
jgi:hypothetical protein